MSREVEIMTERAIAYVNARTPKPAQHVQKFTTSARSD